MTRARSVAALAALSLVLAACDDPTSPQDQLTQEDTQVLAQEMDELVFVLLDDFAAVGPFGVEGPAAAPETSTYTFERTRECRAGGSLTVAGSGTRTIDRETRSADITSSGTKTRNNCAHARGDVTITTNGSGTFTHERHWLERAPSGVWVTTHAGEFTWTRSSGGEGSCAYDLTATIDTAANTWSVSGTMCGREVSKSRSWRDG